MNPQAQAARLLGQLLREQKSLSALVYPSGLCQEMVYGAVRWMSQLEAIIEQLMKKPAKPGSPLQALLLIGLYQLRFMKTPDSAAVNETVKAAKQLKQTWAASVVNAVLRRYLKETLSFDNDEAEFSHPDWMIDEFKTHYPDDWQSMLAANNEYPPMVLRVNTQQQTRDDYLAKLEKQGIQGITLETSTAIQLEKPCLVTQLPGFSKGNVSVQAEASQRVPELLQLDKGQRVLDACSAPGGKLCHCLEHMPGIQMTGVELDAERLKRVRDNLRRLKLSAELKTADARGLDDWWDGEHFDRILLDAPCSGTGVIRRHPDIKLWRRESDIAAMAYVQLRLLETLWQTLKPGGILLYTTCSVLPEENTGVIKAFLESHADASLDRVEMPDAIVTEFGTQILPQSQGIDGFFYAKLMKCASHKS